MTRKASIQSILPDSLDVIEESTEHSEDSDIYSTTNPSTPRRAKADQRIRSQEAQAMASARISGGKEDSYNYRQRSFGINEDIEDSGADSSPNPIVSQSTLGASMTKETQAISVGPVEPDENGLFNYDDDINATQVSEPEEEQLTWRLEPAKSLSDWTIKVFNKETREAEPYHVHKNILAVGPRKSEYFVRSFRNNNRMSHIQTHNTTEVWLTGVACSVIPQWLDYMYSNEGDLETTTEYATGLRHLAQFFGIRVMHKKVMDFILSDLNMTNVQVYYHDSVALADDKIAEMAAMHCAKNILSIEATSTLLSSIDAAFFRKIMSAPEIDSKEKHYHISLLLAEYCSMCKHLLDDQDFMRLSDARNLPHVDRYAALTLMEMEADLCPTLLDPNTLTSLQERCISDLTAHWTDFSEMDQNKIMRVCRKLPSSVVSDLLVKSLAQAKRQLSPSSLDGVLSDGTRTPPGGTVGSGGKSVSGVTAADAKRKKDVDAKIAKLKQQHQEAMDTLKRDYETALARMKEVLTERDAQMQRVWAELMCFERLPNTPDGKVVPSGMMAKASVLPTAGNPSAEGYLLVNKKEGSKFPIFYYKKDLGPPEAAPTTNQTLQQSPQQAS